MAAVLSNMTKSMARRGPIIAAWEKWSLAKHKPRAPDGFWHPSSLSGCPTAAAYEQFGLPCSFPPVDARLLRIFALGTGIHQIIQKDFVAAGLVPEVQTSPGITQYAVELPINLPSLRIVGTLDALVELTPGDRRVLEIKSKHSGSFSKMTDADPRHKAQAYTYTFASMEMGYIKEPKYTVLYYSKDDSELAEFPGVVGEPQLKEIRDKVQLLNEWSEAWDKTRAVPAPFYSVPSKSPCRDCQWASVCFGTLERRNWLAKIKAREESRAQAAPAQAAPVQDAAAPARKPLGLPPRLPPRR